MIFAAAVVFKFRDIRIGLQLGQIGTNWDKPGTFEDQFSVYFGSSTKKTTTNIDLLLYLNICLCPLIFSNFLLLPVAFFKLFIFMGLGIRYSTEANAKTINARAVNDTPNERWIIWEVFNVQLCSLYAII